MSPYILYTARRSGSASVEVLLKILGADFELRDATPWDQPRGPYYDELMTINPLGQLPTLITLSGEVLTESLAVLWTLAERHPNDWIPAPSTRTRAACLRWMSFASSIVYGAVGVADYPERWTTATDEAARTAVQEAAVKRIRYGWDVIARSYTERRYFLEDRPLLVDLYLANLSRWWKMREHLRARHPVFCDLMERIDALPAVAPVWQRHWG